MIETLETGSHHLPQNGAELKNPFNLAAILEKNAQKALEASFGGDHRELAQRLAAARSLDKDSVGLPLGFLSEIGDLSHTNAFSDYRRQILETFPEVRDVRFKTVGLGIYGTGAYVDLCLKPEDSRPAVPALLTQGSTPPKKWKRPEWLGPNML